MKTKNQIYLPLLTLAVLLMIMLSWAIDTSLLTRENEYVGVLLLETLIFAFPCIIFTRFFPPSSGNTLKINFFGPSKLFFAVISAVLLIFGSLMYGFLINGISDSETAFTLYKVFTVKKTDGFFGNLYLILAYALIPAFFEEFTFRGVISSGYEKFSSIYSVIMSSVFFALIHFDLKNFPFYLIAGLVLGIVLYSTGSIFASIIVHFLFNLFFIFASDYVNAFVSADADFAFLIIGVVFFISAFLFCGECKSFYKQKAATEPIGTPKHDKTINVLEIILSPTAVVCYLIYFAVVFLK